MHPPRLIGTGTPTRQSAFLKDRDTLAMEFVRIMFEILRLPDIAPEISEAFRNPDQVPVIIVFTSTSDAEKLEKKSRQDPAFEQLRAKIAELSCEAPGFGRAMNLLHEMQKRYPGLDFGFYVIADPSIPRVSDPKMTSGDRRFLKSLRISPFDTDQKT